MSPNEVNYMHGWKFHNESLYFIQLVSSNKNATEGNKVFK